MPEPGDEMRVLPEARRARRNADAANDGTVRGRVYSRLLHVQLDLQEAGDEEGETLLTDWLDVFCSGASDGARP